MPCKSDFAGTDLSAVKLNQLSMQLLSTTQGDLSGKLLMSECHVHEHLSLMNASCLFTSSKDDNAVSVSTSKAHLLWCQWKDCSFLLQCTLCVLSTSQRGCILQGSLQVTMYLCVFKVVECMSYQCKLLSLCRLLLAVTSMQPQLISSTLDFIQALCIKLENR